MKKKNKGLLRMQKIAKQLQEEFDRARQEQKVVAEAEQAHDIDWSNPAVLRYHALQNRSFSVAEKLVDDAKKEELRDSMDVFSRDDIAIDIYEMLNDFDREDLIVLYRILNEKYASTRPGFDDLMLWGDLKIIVHSLMLREVSIHMLVEKKYPLPQDTLTRMLQWKLHVNNDITEKAYELLRLRFVYCVLPNLKTNTAFCLGGTLPNSFLDCVLSQDMTAFCLRLFTAFCLRLFTAFCLRLFTAFCLRLFTAFCLRLFTAFCLRLFTTQMHNNIMAAGSRDGPPMLATRRYAQWRSHFLRYIDTRPKGDALRKCILDGPYQPTTITIPAVPAIENSLEVPK
ncbi:hypothetical protein Tco_1165851 [Tanacetum coccineum]